MQNKVKEIIKNNVVADHAFGFEPEIDVDYKWDIVKQFKEEGFNYLSLSVATDMTSMADAVKYIAEIRQYIHNHDKDYVMIRTTDDIIGAKQSGRLGISLMFQGSAPIEKNVDMIDVYSELGVRSMILCYNIQNAVGSGCIEPVDTGLSRLGKAVVKRMNNLGMLIDCSHAGMQTSLDIMSQSTQPVVFSHSNVKALFDHPRNLSDEQIIACSKTGGYIGVNGNGPLLGEPMASVKTYVNHIDYIVELVGINHVSLGTDHVYFKEIFDRFMKKNEIVYPSNYNVPNKNTWHSIGPDQIGEIIQELLDRGYTEEGISKIIGGNSIRVLHELDALSRRAHS